MGENMPNGLLIKQIHDKIEKQSNNLLREKGITTVQLFVLAALQQAPKKQLSMKELERHFGVAQSTIAGIISRLEKKRLVEAFGDTADKRVKLAHITSVGENCCAEAKSHVDKTEQILIHGFSKEEEKMFNTLLIKAANNLK